MGRDVPLAGKMMRAPAILRAGFTSILVFAFALGLVPLTRAALPVHAAATVPGLPLFADMVLDEPHGRLFGSDNLNGRLVALALPGLTPLGTISFGQASGPSGLALSPDGTELAVALRGGGAIALVDPVGLAITGQLVPQHVIGPNMPADVRYSRPGRLYSVGDPGSSGIDYVHAFDTATRTEVGTSQFVVRSAPRLALASGDTALYVGESSVSPQALTRFNIAGDTPERDASATFNQVSVATLAIRTDGSTVYTSRAQVWPRDLQSRTGYFNTSGPNIEYVPVLERLFVSRDDTIVEVRAQDDYAVLATRTVSGTAGVARANAAGTRLYVSTSAGLDVVALDAPVYTLAARATDYGAVQGAGTYAGGSVATLRALPVGGAIFTGWTLDGVPVGWSPTLTVTMDGPHTAVANFVARPSFIDVGADGTGGPEAIAQLAARGIVHGYQSGYFGPQDGALRAQMAALITRAMGWDGEVHANPFWDRCAPNNPQDCIDLELWSAVATLNSRDVARGYQDAICGALAPCYGPRDSVLNAQIISFITRAMVAHAYWQRQPDDPRLYPEVTDATHRGDIATYVHYAGAIPESIGSGPTFGGSWAAPATREWLALALWRALDSYLGADHVP